MKVRRFTIAIHSLVWVLLLIIPYASTDQVFRTLDPASDLKYLLLCFILSVVLLGTFYINYLYLVPKYLLTEKYWHYFSYLIIAIMLVLSVSGGIFLLPDLNSKTFATTDPIVEKIIPVIIINAISLWFLALVSSILWMGYNRLKQTESERLSAQIASLKSQINPHFLFNTLNNIYATAIDTAPKAADMVDKLSEMMRYTMRDIQKDLVPLEDEINYSNNFIELQKVRLDRSVVLDYTIPDEVPHLQVAPMLLIPFIENAFKHGVNSEQKSRITISLKVNGTELLLIVTNNKVDVQKDTVERSGLGIENTKHRLNLIYPSKHLLVIKETAKTFSVSLHIDLQ